MIYEFACHDCKITNEVNRPISQAGETASCPVCNEPMQRVFRPVAMLGRQKPRGFKYEPKVAVQDGMHSVAQAIRVAEQKGGEHWAKVKRETSPGEMREVKSYLGSYRG